VLAAAIVRRRGAILVARRPARGLFGGLWAPPLAEVAPGADPARTLEATLRDEHGIVARAGPEVAACERALTHRALALRAFACEIRGVPKGGGLRFVAEPALAALGVPAAVKDLLGRIG
jgi:adenine-specific DNA glycosylase